MAEPPPGSRDYLRLFQAMNTVLRVLSSGEGTPQDALRTSFEAMAGGFGAQKALLLAVEEAEPLKLRSVIALGALTPEEVAACESGGSAPGVSSSVIRGVVASRQAELIRDPRLHPLAQRTAALEGQNHSVLAAPIVDPVSETALAVIYLQSSTVSNAYRDSDRLWLEGYVDALGHAFRIHFARERQQRELEELLQNGARPPGAPELVGPSAHMQRLRRELHQVYIPSLDAPHPDPILLLGERGTGKDLVARYLHAYSARRQRPFVVANCAEISEELAASRLFGHKRGAFTSALSDEPGLFRAAQGGVLFLDEIAELHPRTQAALLRVLENHTVVPVGEAREVPVDVAVVLATNADLDEAVRGGRLRPDFHDRFRTQALRVAPLRERPWDVPPLLDHFRSHHEARTRKRTLGFTPEALRRLVSYGWPGNVRELARVCSLLVTHAAPGAPIDDALLLRCYPDVAGAPANPEAGPLLWEGLSLREAARHVRREIILARLERHQGDLKATRESLKLTRATFHRYLRDLDIRPRRARRAPKPGG